MIDAQTSQPKKRHNNQTVFLNREDLERATSLLADALKTPRLDAASDLKIVEAQELLLPSLLQ